MIGEKFIFKPLDFPDFTVAPKEHWPANVSWDDAMREFASRSPITPPNQVSAEARLRSKNPARFILS